MTESVRVFLQGRDTDARMHGGLTQRDARRGKDG